ncbi:large-conductance mechanosensitive channel protein MscL [Exiguobacterium oxidotolerans]|uniref:Large-conductance mechanosensitive channel n=1 Tax=Exiguobacterium oxidotolerans TaxID=223958 RepID=A0A653I3I0_9BACL|nr:large-conductance mechanosensitive channel protein MscL [Exiguobacterium oxidotolerans]VWX33239.1 Large-conductance mechanosensitive channel [Exiguobacterium oxidotolerans]
MFKAFKEFAFRGNVVDLAIGVILGAAFSSIIKALVNSIFMPLIGIVIGGVNVKGLSVSVGSAELLYGQFLQATIEFILIAFALFLFVKAINRFRSKEEVTEEVPEPTTEEKLLTEIRDALVSRNDDRI